MREKKKVTLSALFWKKGMLKCKASSCKMGTKYTGMNPRRYKMEPFRECVTLKMNVFLFRGLLALSSVKRARKNKWHF